MTALRPVFYIFFGVVALLGAVFFGPEEYTGPIKEQFFYQTYLKPIYLKTMEIAGVSGVSSNGKSVVATHPVQSKKIPLESLNEVPANTPAENKKAQQESPEVVQQNLVQQNKPEEVVVAPKLDSKRSRSSQRKGMSEKYRQNLAHLQALQIVPKRIAPRPRPEGGRGVASLEKLPRRSSLPATLNFNKKVRMKVDSQMRSYVKNGNCKQGKRTLASMENKYPREKKLAGWTTYWTKQFRKQGCKI